MYFAEVNTNNREEQLLRRMRLDVRNMLTIILQVVNLLGQHATYIFLLMIEDFFCKSLDRCEDSLHLVADSKA